MIGGVPVAAWPGHSTEKDVERMEAGEYRALIKAERQGVQLNDIELAFIEGVLDGTRVIHEHGSSEIFRPEEGESRERARSHERAKSTAACDRLV